MVQQYATKEEAEEEKFRNSEWGPEKSGSMIEKVKHFLLPFGSGTLGDLIDQTPRDKISRVHLEDKLFETWTYGRTVLIGDAVHKVEIEETMTLLLGISTKQVCLVFEISCFLVAPRELFVPCKTRSSLRTVCTILNLLRTNPLRRRFRTTRHSDILKSKSKTAIATSMLHCSSVR